MNHIDHSVASPHLTPDQFAEFAFDSGLHAADFSALESLRRIDPVGADHLAACHACREDMDRFLDSILSFNTASLSWAESRPTSSVPLRTKPRLKWASIWANPTLWAPRAAWAMAACLMVVALFFSSMRLHRDEAPGAPPMLAQDSDAEIASDNQLMSQIDREIRRPDRSPVSEYGLGLEAQSSASHTRSPKPRPESRVE